MDGWLDGCTYTYIFVCVRVSACEHVGKSCLMTGPSATNPTIKKAVFGNGEMLTLTTHMSKIKKKNVSEGGG